MVFFMPDRFRIMVLFVLLALWLRPFEIRLLSRAGTHRSFTLLMTIYEEPDLDLVVEPEELFLRSLLPTLEQDFRRRRVA